MRLTEKSGMRAFRSVLASVIVLVAMLWAAPAYSSHGPATITALSIDPRPPLTIYAGTSGGGVFKSTDGGTNWSQTGFTDGWVVSLVVDLQTPATVYAVTGRGMFKSLDGGQTWSAIVGPHNATITALAIDPAAPTILYAALSYYSVDEWGGWMSTGAVAKSADGGMNWTSVSLPSGVLALAIDPMIPTNLYAGTEQVPGYFLDTVYGDVFTSTDGGASWAPTYRWLGSVVVLAIAPGTPSTLYAGTSSGAVVNYSTGTVGSLADGIGALAIDPRNPSTVYGGTGNWVFKSTDGGATWRPTSPQINCGGDPSCNFVPVPALVIDPVDSNTLYAGTNDGVYKSTDSGVNWNRTGVITWPHISSVSLNPTTVTGGSSSTGRVTLSSAAPAGGAVVHLGDRDTSVVTVPASVTVPAGATSATFTVSTSPVAASASVEIGAFYGGYYSYAALTVNPVSPPDTTAPDTSIASVVDGNGASVPNSGATLSNATTVAFTGNDNIAVTGFECRLDGGDFTPCTSPATYSGLAVGGHSFEVRAVDKSGNQDGSPAAHAWSVDAPPDTIITAAIDGRGNAIPNGGTTRSDKIKFSFTGSDNTGVASFECSLNGVAFAACASPKTYSGIARRTHTFRVRAVDGKGFRDESPAAFTWTRR